MKIADVAKALGADPPAAEVDLLRLVHPADATAKTDLALALTPDTLNDLSRTKAGAAVVRADTPLPDGVVRLAWRGHERIALAMLTRMFDPGPAHGDGIDPRAVVASDAKLAAGVHVGAFATVGAGSEIGARTAILSGAFVGAGVTVGSDCVIHPGVRIVDRVRLGDRVVVQPNAVIGGDGFSFVPVRNPDGTRNPIDAPLRIHSVGTVIVGDDVEIGAGTTIDRATLRQTRIGRGTKIDNQVQIGHNVVIGEACLICGMAGLAGSVVIGDRVLIGAAAGISDHLTIGSDATIGADAGVARDVPAGTIVMGTPAVERKVMIERYMNVGRLRMLFPRVGELADRLEALEKAGAAR
ncbi:MAG TPA: UDP-3-O-(3-hydroxymyristoyl)glucosamine N-acyltransferase [Bauldia sp.]|nr:UDP-3-O-(3-hydroxymyristoyl)glucosamine N-acyltransferase [Bauldia sp.]